MGLKKTVIVVFLALGKLLSATAPFGQEIIQPVPTTPLVVYGPQVPEKLLSASPPEGGKLLSAAVSRGQAAVYSDIFEITAYVATGHRTATGTIPKAQHTIATDWKILKPGTVVTIEGLPGEFVVEDSGGAIKGKKIDLFVDSISTAVKWGRQKRRITVIR